jgi:hypothetical protein
LRLARHFGASLPKAVPVNRFRTFAQCRRNGFVAVRIVSSRLLGPPERLAVIDRRPRGGSFYRFVSIVCKNTGWGLVRHRRLPRFLIAASWQAKGDAQTSGARLTFCKDLMTAWFGHAAQKFQRWRKTTVARR